MPHETGSPRIRYSFAMAVNTETDLKKDGHRNERQKNYTSVGTEEEGHYTAHHEMEDVLDEATLKQVIVPSVIPIEVGLPAPAPEAKSKLWLAVVMLLISVVGSVIDQQLLKNAFSEEFNAPFFMLFVGNAMRLFTLPLYVVTVWLTARLRGRQLTVGKISRDASILKSNDPLWIYIIKSIGIITSFIILVMSLAIMSLSYATVSEVAAVSTTQVAMVYFVAVIFLGHKVLLGKVFAVLVSLAGVGVIAYAKGIHSSSAVGIGLIMLSTVFFSFNVTYYKYVYKRMNFGQCCSFLSSASLFLFVIFWWLPVWTSLSGVEVWEWHSVPWTLLLASSASSWVTAMSMNYGLGLATPLLMTFGSLLRIPCNVVIDICIRQVEFTELEMVGSALIVVGFLIIVIPDERISMRIKPRLHCLRKQEQSL